MNEVGRYGTIYGLPRNGGNNGGNHQNRNGCNGIGALEEREYGVLLLHLLLRSNQFKA
jgi:hypothetical protein